MLHMSSKHARRRPKRSARRIPTRERRKYPRHAPTIMCTSVSCLANHWYADPPVCGPDNAVVRFRRHAHAVGADEHYTPRARAPIRSLPSLHELAGFETARVLRGDSAPPIHLAEPLRLAPNACTRRDETSLLSVQIRAANLSGDCSWLLEAMRGHFNIRAQQEASALKRCRKGALGWPWAPSPQGRSAGLQICTKRRALLSLRMAHPHLSEAQAKVRLPTAAVRFDSSQRQQAGTQQTNCLRGRRLWSQKFSKRATRTRNRMR